MSKLSGSFLLVFTFIIALFALGLALYNTIYAQKLGYTVTVVQQPVANSVAAPKASVSAAITVAPTTKTMQLPVRLLTPVVSKTPAS